MQSTATRSSATRAARLATLALICAAASAEVGGIAPRFLVDPASPQARAQVRPTDDGQATATLAADGIAVAIRGGDAEYPGVRIVPPDGKPWDLTPWGHIEATITNAGTAPVTVALRVDNAGDWSTSPWSTENATIAPGATSVVKVVFGYSWGFKPSTKIDRSAITQLLFFVGKSAQPRALRITDVEAAGAAGESPPADASTLRTRPERGALFARGAKVDAQQVRAAGGATAAFAADGIAVELPARDGAQIAYGPAAGAWRLDEALQVVVRVRNVGASAASPRVRVESKGGPTDLVTAPAIAPGAVADVVVPFAAATPARISTDARQETFGPGAWNEQNWGPQPGTGTGFVSGWATAVAILGDGTAASLRVESITAGVPEPSVPAWLGTRPPVDGDWSVSFEDRFDSDAIDLRTWNVHSDNYWDKRTHFAQDDAVVKGGVLTLRYEKKRGPQNDDPNDTKTVGTTDYAAGYADTYGKWTQRYGYFEARVKLPKAAGLWPAFWLMPDRGVAAGEQWKRSDTAQHGMEFDILEYLSGWGPYRYNLAFHWDGYGKEHKSAGSATNYVQPDRDGFITVGLLWTPGLAAYYAQGRELLRWESPRVCDQPCFIIFNLVSGGWDNEPLDDARLPEAFVIDHVRVWQRKDLASAVDGRKPNAGLPSSLGK